MTAESFQERRKKAADEAKVKADAASVVFWEKLQAKLTERGHVFELDDRNRLQKLDGIRNIGVSIRPEKEHPGYGAPISGKLRVTVGDWGEKKQFHQSRARGGDFDYDAIADELKNRVVKAREYSAKRREEHRIEAEAIEIRNRLVREFYANFKEGEIKDEFSDVKGPYVHPPEEATVRLKHSEIGLTIEFKKPLNEDQLREILSACKKVGLI